MVFRISRKFNYSTIFNIKKDFYSILEVPHSASELEIKQSYFKLAKKYHPDINKSPDAQKKFAEISLAYKTLGNRNKKKNYDNTGMNADEQERVQSSGFDAGDFEFNPFKGFAGNPGLDNFQNVFYDFEDFEETENIEDKENNILVSIYLTFNDSIKGYRKQVNFETKRKCLVCKGSGIKLENNPCLCGECGGRGNILRRRGAISIQSKCSKCRGTGFLIKSYCVPCNGTGYSYTNTLETVRIPPGVVHGQSLRLANKGHQSEKGSWGDLIVKVNVEPHPSFRRIGQDIHSDVFLTASQAALGTVLEIQTLYGNTKVNIDPGTTSGQQKKIPFQGMPYSSPYQTKKGDHIVTMNVKIQKKITDNIKKSYQKLEEEEEKCNHPLFSQFKMFC
jgi:molecular chaperone DnaJ